MGGMGRTGRSENAQETLVFAVMRSVMPALRMSWPEPLHSAARKLPTLLPH
jgi:hypothetical protein